MLGARCHCWLAQQCWVPLLARPAVLAERAVYDCWLAQQWLGWPTHPSLV